MILKPAIIVDIDGTLANSDTRKNTFFPEGGKKNWKGFYEDSINDFPHEWCLDIIERFRNFYSIILVTGRPGEYHDLTKQWLKKHGIYFDVFHGRTGGDYRTDFIIKEEIYLNKIRPEFEIIFAIDDRKQVVDMWRRNGITCLQCAEGNF